MDVDLDFEHAATREAAMAAFREELATEVRHVGFCPRKCGRSVSPSSMSWSDRPQAVFESIHRTCLSALVADRAMEPWYHRSIA
jgi:hypothetical protein